MFSATAFWLSFDFYSFVKIYQNQPNITITFKINKKYLNNKIFQILLKTNFK